MDVWELAKVIHDENVQPLNPKKRIVAEHMLNVPLAHIQARPGYIAVLAGLVGVVGGAFLTSALQKPDLDSCSHFLPRSLYLVHSPIKKRPEGRFFNTS